jgi:hypothetical protein
MLSRCCVESTHAGVNRLRWEEIHGRRWLSQKCTRINVMDETAKLSLISLENVPFGIRRVSRLGANMDFWV